MPRALLSVSDKSGVVEVARGLATLVRALRIESLEARFPLAVPFTMTAGGPVPGPPGVAGVAAGRVAGNSRRGGRDNQRRSRNI